MSNKTLGNKQSQPLVSGKSLIIGLILALLIFAIWFAYSLLSNKNNVNKSDQNVSTQAAHSSKDYSPEIYANIQKLGAVQQVQKIQGNLLAWTVLINNQPQIIFTTPDEELIITGNAFDSTSMDSVSLPILQAAQGKFNANAELAGNDATNAVSVDFAEIVGTWDKELPSAISILAKLKGAKEGNGSDADTLYVLYDPRCPNCHDAYRATRSYVAKGFSIKWIPTVLLKKSEDGYKLGAATLKDPTLLGKAFTKDTTGLANATPEEMKAIDENQQFLVEATQQSTGSNTIAVPTAFYLNKKNGQPKMTTGLSDNSILEMIFGKI